MIKFKRIKAQNFFSIGNAAVEVRLDKNPTTLIVGENGAGKSVMGPEALCFALFGKPYRDINKPQIVNSITNKQCRVEIEFSIGSKNYHIVRGIKPNIFEIWEDGVLLNQDAAVKDYQKFLEETILKMNYKSFTQIVVLGTASYTPFMQLTTAARREIIEELLDIKIFTAMNQVLKERVSSLKSRLSAVDGKIDVLKSKTRIQKEYILTLQNDRDTRLDELLQQKKDLSSQLKALKVQISEKETARDTLAAAVVDKAEVVAALREAEKRLIELETALKRLAKDIAFYEDNPSCPTCKQDIDESFRDGVVENFQADETYYGEKKDSVVPVITGLKKQEAEFAEKERELQSLKVEIASLSSKRDGFDRQIEQIKKEYLAIESNLDKLEEEKEKLTTLASEGVKLVTERSEIVESQQYTDIAVGLLKDSGIKTRIINQYVPTINTLVNKYLTTMDFFVQFTLDEKFEETIKSRHRDNFSYASFSEGEKQRIDLALLFTWRQIAKMKNSTNTNLLFLDEVFDSSLDEKGSEHVMSLLRELSQDAHVFVISHKGKSLEDKFKHVIRFEKDNNFTVMV